MKKNKQTWAFTQVNVKWLWVVVGSKRQILLINSYVNRLKHPTEWFFIVMRKQEAFNSQRIQEFRTFSVNDAEYFFDGFVHLPTQFYCMRTQFDERFHKPKRQTDQQSFNHLRASKLIMRIVRSVCPAKWTSHQIYSQWLFYIFLFLAFLFAVNNNKMSMRSK